MKHILILLFQTHLNFPYIMIIPTFIKGYLLFIHYGKSFMSQIKVLLTINFVYIWLAIE